MRLSEGEMLFINSVTKGRTPFGIICKYPEESKMEEYKKEVVLSLRKKGILDDEKKFTPKGIALLLLWEQYRNSERHMVLNHLMLSVSTKRRVICVAKMSDGYEVFSADSGFVMFALLKRHEFLRSQDTKCPIVLEKLLYEEWTESLGAYGDGLLITGIYRKNEPEREEVYCWRGETGYKYDLSGQFQRKISARTVRMRLMSDLGRRREDING